jgi:predicted esterase
MYVSPRLFSWHPVSAADTFHQGILGYSEGATTAATLVLEEARRAEEEGRPRRIKTAVFFAGWPPVSLVNGEVKTLLADECEDVIDIPTCHIIGCNDPYVQGAMALFSMCDEDTTTLFDHGKGHTVPRDPRTIKELAAAIQQSVERGNKLSF